MEKQYLQGTPEWLDLRKRFVGASDAPVIMGVSPYKTVRELWEEKLGLGKKEISTQAAVYGKEMEEPARRAYEKHTGNLVAPAVVFHPEFKFMMASLDGLTFDKNLAVEIKNVKTEDHEEAKSGKVPDKYFPQVQHQLAVLGIPVMHYFSFRYGDFALVEVKRDEEYIDKLYKSEASFWEDVQNLREPKLSEKDYLLINDPQTIALANEWRELNEQIKLLDAKEKEYRKVLIEKSNERNALIGDLRLTKSIRKGSVDYSGIDELKGIDLDKYRKDPIVSWRFS